MKRLPVLAGITGVLSCTALLAAPVDQHLRGQIVSVSPDTLLLHTDGGTDVSVSLNGATHYLQVVPSSLDKIEPGSYIGTATKEIGTTQVALEVMIFPAAMQGLNAGHFDYDRLPDTTLAGTRTTPSKMTNGNVSAVSAQGPTVSTKMTNGNVSASTSGNGVRHLTVTYQGGQQSVLVPPTTPIVNLVPGTISDLAKGAYVFVYAAQDGSSVTAGLVAAGVRGMKPPF
jgi:hypothetical protein